MGRSAITSPVILVVDGDETARRLLEDDLRRRYGERFRIEGVSSGVEALQRLRNLKEEDGRAALIVVDHRPSGLPEEELLLQAAAIFPEAKRVLLVPIDAVDVAINAIRRIRLDHYLPRPWRPPEQNLYPPIDDLLADWQAGVRPRFEGIKVVGHRFSPHCHQTRDFLARNCIPFQWLDVEKDEEARRLAASHPNRLPLVVFPDGAVLVEPTSAEIAGKIGLQVRPQGDFYDLTIVGGGPSGLAAAVYAASEGLRTVMVEREAPGGQAGLSGRIENYLGFPAGISGADLARRAVAQARKFQAEVITPQRVDRLEVSSSLRTIVLGDGCRLHCHAVLLAMGVEWRRLDVPGIDRLTGAGVYYGGTLAEAIFCRDEDIFIVGGANSAGQAALSFSSYARTVTLLVRGDSLEKSMSRYLIDQIRRTPSIRVRLRTEVVEARGRERLEELVLLDRSTGRKETVRTASLFIFIGALPHTGWLESLLEMDRHGFILTGPHVGTAPSGGGTSWPLGREPFWLESSVPGIFAAGDVRHGSVKRVAAGVGEGSVAVRFIHEYLSSAVHA